MRYGEIKSACIEDFKKIQFVFKKNALSQSSMILSSLEMIMVMNGNASQIFPSSLQNVTFREDKHHGAHKQTNINKNKMEEHLGELLLTICLCAS